MHARWGSWRPYDAPKANDVDVTCYSIASDWVTITRQDPPILVVQNDTTANPRLAMNQTADFAVIWRSLDANHSVKVRLGNATSLPCSFTKGPLTVNTGTGGVGSVTVAINKRRIADDATTYDVVAAWDRSDPATGRYHVYASICNDCLAPLSSFSAPVHVDGADDGNSQAPFLALNGNGRGPWEVVWKEVIDDSLGTKGVYLKHYQRDSMGHPIFTPSTWPTNPFRVADLPFNGLSFALSNDADGVVAYQLIPPTTLTVRQHDESGAFTNPFTLALTGPSPLLSPGGVAKPAGSDADPNTIDTGFVVGWQDKTEGANAHFNYYNTALAQWKYSPNVQINDPNVTGNAQDMFVTAAINRTGTQWGFSWFLFLGNPCGCMPPTDQMATRVFDPPMGPAAAREEGDEGLQQTDRALASQVIVNQGRMLIGQESIPAGAGLMGVLERDICEASSCHRPVPAPAEPMATVYAQTVPDVIDVAPGGTISVLTTDWHDIFVLDRELFDLSLETLLAGE